MRYIRSEETAKCLINIDYELLIGEESIAMVNYTTSGFLTKGEFY